MKFKDYKYERPDFQKISATIDKITKECVGEKNVDNLIKLIDKSNEIKSHFSSMQTLAFIRNTLNTVDEYYQKEVEEIQNNSPIVTSSYHKLAKVLVNHSLREKLEEVYGKYWFLQMELSLKTFDDSIMDLMVEESKLSLEYDKLMASCQVEFMGKVNNLSQLRKYLSDTNRDIRKEAMLKICDFLGQKEELIDDIFDKLVHVRDQMAKKLGYENYVELGYARMGRTDYNANDVKLYREQVLKYLVPISQTIIENNLKRIKVSDAKFYDLGLEFLDGNPTPKGNKEELVSKAMKMYSEMSSETKEFFSFMVEHDLLDLETKPGKANGGYCTYIPDYKSPFIFSNFNGTKGDVDVLTHEAGHAFMAYSCRDSINNPDLCWPTSEACEIHSMSMEFFSYPWMNLFFLDDEIKYKISHMSSAITFIPYGVCVDHFQHIIYENPQFTKEERKQVWSKLEKLYTPWRNMEDIPLYKKGCYWYNQPHIFSSPFYYIDYTLAQVCAFEFYLNSLEDRDVAWNRYVKLCKLGGSMSFLNLLKEVGLENPFVEGTMANIVNRLLPVIDNLNQK